MLRNLLLLTVASLFSLALVGQTTDLLFSEYVEGSSNNKYLEIYNGTGASVNLTNYTVKLYANGATSPNNTENLSGTLNDGEVLVLANSGATIYGGTTQISSVCNFNGNDAITLENSGTEIDVIGEVGSSSVFGENETLRRNSSICSPTTNFDKVGEWTLLPQDNIADLGAHTENCSSACPLSITITNATCDTETSGTDTYTAFFDFTGGGSATYTVTSDVGTVDLTNGNPDADASGTIEVIGINEGTDVTLTIEDGADCNLMETVTSPVCEPAPVIVINEFLPDPDSDVNGDGSFNFSEDEFIEIYNTGNSAVDLTGWTINDATGIRHTFPATTLNPGVGLVVFGGGMPTGFAVETQIASTGDLGFNNGGDDISLEDDSGIVIDEVSYSSSSNDISIARDPDFTGPFVDHDAITSNPVNSSPGLANTDGTSLPVQWLSFSADKTNAGVELSWRVAEEVNVEKYIVERSADARNWMPIGQVIAEDNYRIGSYNFVDKKPLTENVYYRVQEVDYDGYTEYSVTRSVSLGSQKLDLINTIAENRLYLNRSMEGQYEIFSIDGRRVKANNHSGNEINVSDLNSGIYILKVKEGSIISTYKFTK